MEDMNYDKIVFESEDGDEEFKRYCKDKERSN